MIALFGSIFYVASFSYLVAQSEFFGSIGLSKKTVAVLALMKMLAGIAYIYIQCNVIGSGDILLYFRDGQIIFNELFQNPANYFRLTFGLNNTSISPQIANTVYEMGFWGDTSAYLIVRFNALVSLFSFGNIYIHGIFSGFLSFVGCFLLAKAFKTQLNASKLALLAIFLFPSVFLWTSGIHKEFVSTLALGVIVYNFFQFFHSHSYKNAGSFLLGFALLFLVREHIAALLVPCLISYTIYHHTKFNPLMVFGGVYLLLAITFIAVPIPFTDGTAIDLILNKKELFKSLKTGNTHIELNDYSDLKGILFQIPQALYNTTIRPVFSEANTFLLKVASVESFLFTVLLLFSIVYLPFYKGKPVAFLVFFLAFGISYLVVTGLIVPNIGAILRYRSLAILMLTPLIFTILSEKFTFFKKLTSFFNKC
jgi:hypothetical protein